MKLATILLAAAAAPLAAQPQPELGHFESTAMGMIFEPLNQFDASIMSYKYPPFGGNPPLVGDPLAPIFPDRQPDHRISTIQRDFNAALSLGPNIPLRFDGMASGNAVIPGSLDTTTSRLNLAGGWPNQWGAMFLSVSNATATGTWYQNGSDILAFYADNTDLPDILDGETYREFEAGMAAVLPEHAGATPDIQALDVAMPNIWLLAPTGVTEWMPDIDTIYFTVPKLHATIFYGGYMLDYEPLPNTQHQIDGTSIIAADWVIDSLHPLGWWTNFRIALDSTDIDGLSTADDVDALAVGPLISGELAFTISHERITNNTSFGLDQLRVVAKSGSTFYTADIHRNSASGGGKVLDAVGVQGQHEVDAVCWQDPETNTHGALYGTPFSYGTKDGDFPLSATHYPGLLPGFPGYVFGSFTVSNRAELVGTTVRINVLSEIPPMPHTNPWGVFGYGKYMFNLGTISANDFGTQMRFELPTGVGIKARLKIEYVNNAGQVIWESYENGFRWF